MNLTANQGLLAAFAVLVLAPLAVLGWMGRLRVFKGLASVSLPSWCLLALISPISAILAGSVWLFLRRRRERRDSARGPVVPSGGVVSTQATELGLRGAEVLRHVKQDPGLRRIPTTVMTSSKAEEDISAARPCTRIATSPSRSNLSSSATSCNSWSTYDSPS
jgi:hypothetical protein